MDENRADDTRTGTPEASPQRNGPRAPEDSRQPSDARPRRAQPPTGPAGARRRRDPRPLRLRQPPGGGHLTAAEQRHAVPHHLLPHPSGDHLGRVPAGGRRADERDERTARRPTRRWRRATAPRTRPTCSPAPRSAPGPASAPCPEIDGISAGGIHDLGRDVLGGAIEGGHGGLADFGRTKLTVSATTTGWSVLLATRAAGCAIHLHGRLDRGVELARQVERVLDDDVLLGEVDRPFEDRVGLVRGADDLVRVRFSISLMTISVSMELDVAAERDRAEDRDIHRLDVGIVGTRRTGSRTPTAEAGQRQQGRARRSASRASMNECSILTSWRPGLSLGLRARPDARSHHPARSAHAPCRPCRPYRPIPLGPLPPFMPPLAVRRGRWRRAG